MLLIGVSIGDEEFGPGVSAEGLLLGHGVFELVLLDGEVDKTL